MDRFNSFFLSITFALFLGACATPIKPIPRDIAALKETGKVAGIWFLQGTSSTRGPYNGELELRPSNDGTFDVVRMVTYINYFYDGLRVQEVWVGKAVPDSDTITISYDLRQGEFITRLGETNKTVKDLRTPITIITRFFPTPAGLAAQFSDKKFSEYSEWLTTSRPLEARPLWQKEVQVLSAKGKPIPSSERQKIQRAQRVLNFAKDPFIQAYKAKPTFRNEQPEMIVEGDIEFYRNNKEIIRLINKITDDATIAESVLKQNAYMPAAQEKAARYEDLVEKKNFSSANLVVARKAEQDSLVPFEQDNLAAFTTGMYLASQAMRYHVSKNAQSLQNLKRGVSGLRNLAEISKDTAEIASAMGLRGTQDPEGWNTGSGAYQNYIWLKGDQKQSLLGILHGLTLVATIVPRSESDLWLNLQEIVKILNSKNLLALSESAHGTLSGLNALVLGDTAASEKFVKALPPKGSFYWAGNADWNAEFENLLESINHIQLANSLGHMSVAERWKQYLANEWDFFAPLPRTLRAFVTFGLGSSKNTSTGLTTAVRAAVQSLNDIPYPRPRMDARIDHSGDPDWVASPIPRNYWTVTTKNLKSVHGHYQGLQQLPVYKLHAISSRFIWKEDAFQFQTQGNKNIEATGVDYLYAYWLARYCGVPGL